MANLKPLKKYFRAYTLSFSLQLVCHLLIALEACVVRGGFLICPAVVDKDVGMQAAPLTESLDGRFMSVPPAPRTVPSTSAQKWKKQWMNGWTLGDVRRGENRQSHSSVWVGGEGDVEHRWWVHHGGGWTLFWSCEQHVDRGVAVFLQVQAQKYLDTCSQVCSWTPGRCPDPITVAGIWDCILTSSPGDWCVPLWGPLTQEPRRG